MQSEKPQIATDPNLVAEQAQAHQALITSLQTQAQADTANLMTRYGTRLALGSAGMSPTEAPTASSPFAPAFAAMQSGGLAGLFKSVA